MGFAILQVYLGVFAGYSSAFATSVLSKSIGIKLGFCVSSCRAAMGMNRAMIWVANLY